MKIEVLECFYRENGESVGESVIKQDIIAHAREISTILSVPAHEYKLIMANLSKNGRLTLENVASVISTRANKSKG